MSPWGNFYGDLEGFRDLEILRDQIVFLRV